MQMILPLFIKNDKSATEVIKTLKKFSLYSGFKINNAKCEIAGIGVKKGIKMTLCGMECTDLRSDVINFKYLLFLQQKLEQEKNFFNHIVKIQNILKLWKLRNLSIEGRIAVFKSLAISELTHLSLVTEIPTSTINLLIKYRWNLFGKGKLRILKVVLYIMITGAYL